MAKMDKFLREHPETFGKYELPEGHEDRFLAKLKEQNKVSDKPKIKRFNYARIAAMLIPLVMVGALIFNGTAANLLKPAPELAEIDPELSEAESYFAFAIEQKLEEVKSKQTPENKAVVDEALVNLEELEEEYQELIEELGENGANPPIIRAILANFDLRSQILEELLVKIEWSNQLKEENNETSI